MFLAVVLFAIEPVAAEDTVEVSESTLTATVAETDADAGIFLVTGNTETVACECTGTLADIFKTINQGTGIYNPITDTVTGTCNTIDGNPIEFTVTYDRDTGSFTGNYNTMSGTETDVSEVVVFAGKYDSATKRLIFTDIPVVEESPDIPEVALE